MTIEETQTDDEFDKAFDEDEAAPADAAEPAETGDAADPAEAAEPTQADPAQSAAPAEPATDNGDPQDDWQSRYADVEQRLKSTDGRLRAAEREKAELRARLDAIETQRQPDPAPPKEDGKIDDPDLAKLADDYPDLVGPVYNAMSRQVQVLEAKLAEQIQPLNERATRLDRDTHFAKITAKHADAAEIAGSPEFEAWIEARPAYLRTSIEAIVERGSADQVIGLLDDYKQSREAAAAAAKAEAARASHSQTRAKQLEAAAAVPSASGGLPRTPADPNDFDAAFEEAPE